MASISRARLNVAHVRPTPPTRHVYSQMSVLVPERGHCDLVLVHPNNSAESPKVAVRRKVLTARMRFVGLEVTQQISRDEDEVFLKIAAPDSLLEEMAEQICMDKRLRVGGYSNFTRESKKLFVSASGTSFFSSLERQRLILAAMQLGLVEGGCDIDLDGEIESKVLTSVVPIHDVAISQGRLMNSWCLASVKWWPSQPLDEVRDYFGERVALYFAFVQHLTRAMLLPSAVGAVAIAYGFVYGSIDNLFTPLYSLFVMIWMPWFCKSWRREEAWLAYRWNVEDFEETERQRPEFRGPKQRGAPLADGACSTCISLSAVAARRMKYISDYN